MLLKPWVALGGKKYPKLGFVSLKESGPELHKAIL